jgi:hypothetical protein
VPVPVDDAPPACGELQTLTAEGCVCAAGHFDTMAAADGAATCEPCRAGMSCDAEGTTLENAQPMPGYYRSAVDGGFYRCVRPEQCPST